MIRSSKRLTPPGFAAVKTSLVLLSLLGLVGCNILTNAKPSDAQIQKAIMDRGAWNPLIGRVELQSVQIEEIGIFNVEKKYWPVKARVTTTAGRTAVLEFQVFRDDYGKWAARPVDRS